jgi:hypothetical protein
MMQGIMKTSHMMVLAVLGIAMAVSAQSLDTILLPIVPGQFVPGAFGSQWLTTAVATNISDTPLQLGGFFPCNFGPCIVPPMPPHTSIQITGVPGCSEVPGASLLIEAGREHDLAITLRSQDVTRQRETWGTTIPVVTANDGFEQRFGLTDVPLDPQFRSTLRIYALSAAVPAAVRVRIFSEDLKGVLPGDAPPDVVLIDTQPQFVIPKTGGGCPATVQLWLSSLPQLASQQRVRVEIEPLTGTKYWGFVSVTHNTTQHVTVITPQPQ